MADSFCNKATESLICSNMLIYSGMKQDVFSDTKRRRNKKRKTCGQVWCPILGNLCSAFNPPKCTHTVVNTHTPGAVGSQCCGTRGAVGGFGVLLKGTSVVVLKVEGAVGGSVSCSRAPQSWYWRWREQLGVQCLAQGSHLSRGIEGRESSWGFGVLLKGTSVVVLKVERAVGGFGVLLKDTSVVVLKVKRAVGGSVSCSRTPQSWYWRWREQLGVQCLAQGHLSRGIEGGESSWGFGALLKSTSVVVLKVERAVWGSVSCSRVSPQSWYWRWREQLGVQCLAQEHLSRGIEGGGSSWGFSALLKSTSVVVLKVEGAVGGSVSCSRAPAHGDYIFI